MDAPAPRARRLALARSVWGFTLLGPAGLLCCSNTGAALPYTPYTGIAVDSTSLAAPFGCGDGPEQVYRYVAVVSRDTGAGDSLSPIAATAVDCVTDAVFENLPPSDAGSYAFAIEVYAFNRSSLPADLSCDPSRSCAITLQIAQADRAFATWTARCSATEEVGAPVFASCAALQRSGSPAPDAGTDADADADVAGDLQQQADALAQSVDGD